MCYLCYWQAKKKKKKKKKKKAMVSVRKAIAALSWMLVLRSSLCKQGLQGEYWGLQSLCCSSSVLFGHSFYCLTVPIIHFRFPLLIKYCHVYAVIIIKTVVLKIQINDQPLYIFMLFWLFLKLWSSLYVCACDVPKASAHLIMRNIQTHTQSKPLNCTKAHCDLC